MVKYVCRFGLPAGVWWLMAASAWALPPQSQPSTAPAASQSRPALQGLKIEAGDRRITLDARVCLTAGPLELLVCKAQTKEYESILSTKAAPSDLHAALLALGLTTGKPARGAVNPVDGTSHFLPPQGPQLAIRLRWQDEQGKTHEVPAADWLESPGQKKVDPPKSWVFVGSDFAANGGYWADSSGDMISVANFPDSVIDVPFESTSKDSALYYEAKAKAIPPKGTEVEVIIEPQSGAEKAADARVTLEIDRFGRFSVEGKVIPAEQLETWAEQFKADHSKAQVNLRIDGRAMAYDIRRATEELRIGGIFDVTQQVLSPPGEVLPRTAQDARAALEYWSTRFAHPEDFMHEPSQDAAALLGQIQAQMNELDTVKALLADYAQQVSGALKKYQATTQAAAPASGGAKQEGGGE